MAYYIYYTLYIVLMRVYTESQNRGEKGKVKFSHMRWETDLDISVL